MKRSILIASALVFSQIIFSCGDKPAKVEVKKAKVEKVSENKSVSVKINTSTSQLNWRANKLVGGHEGTFGFENGTLELKNNKVVGGQFTIDIASIIVTDVTEAEDNKKIVDHLLDPDFFDAPKFPKAQFTITGVKGDIVTGDLEMKGVKNSISVKMNTTVSDKAITLASDKFTIDRTKWGIKYNSGSFFDAAKLGNYLIKDDVEMSVSLKANL